MQNIVLRGESILPFVLPSYPPIALLFSATFRKKIERLC